LEVIVLAAMVVVALAVSAVAAAGSGGDAEDNAWNFPILFLEKVKSQTNH
jgi:hypothetical protein